MIERNQRLTHRFSVAPMMDFRDRRSLQAQTILRVLNEYRKRADVVAIKCIALSGLLRIMQITVMETVQRRIYTRSAFDIAYRIPRFRTELLSQYYAPELMNRFFDTLTLQKGIPKIITDISTSALQIFFGLLLISFYHPFFAFFGVGLLLFLFIIFRFTGPPGLASNLKVSKYKYETVYWLEELARSMTTFKLAGNTDFHLKKVDYIVSKYLDFRKSHFVPLLKSLSYRHS